MSTLNFAPGEGNITEAEFSPSVVLFWLRTNIGASTTRIVTRWPNTILGIIPLGYADNTYPLRNVAAVSVNAKFSVRNLVFGLIFFIGGLSSLGQVPILGIILTLFGISLLANTMSADLIIQNNGGGKSHVHVSILQKSKLEQFREEINQRLFADHEFLRHNQHMEVQNQQLSVQQQQLNAQIMQQNAMLQQQQQQFNPVPQQPQQPQQPANPAPQWGQAPNNQ